MFRGSAARPRSVMLRGERCGHLDAWPVGGSLAGGGVAHRLGCAAPWPALALCVAERAVLPLELGDLVHGRRARGRRSRDEAAAPGGSVTDHHRRAGGIQVRTHHGCFRTFPGSRQTPGRVRRLWAVVVAGPWHAELPASTVQRTRTCACGDECPLASPPAGCRNWNQTLSVGFPAYARYAG